MQKREKAAQVSFEHRLADEKSRLEKQVRKALPKAEEETAERIEAVISFKG